MLLGLLVNLHGGRELAQNTQLFIFGLIKMLGCWTLELRAQRNYQEEVSLLMKEQLLI